jgi:hypothetical protein
MQAIEWLRPGFPGLHLQSIDVRHGPPRSQSLIISAGMPIMSSVP